MPLTLYTLDASPPARSVDLVIHALGLPAEYKSINLFEKQQLTADYLKLNPLHTIPAIDDDGFVLWESRAIMTYLVSKYGKDDSLYPKDLKRRAIVDQRLHYSNDAFYILKASLKPILFFNENTIPAEKLTKIQEVQENVEKLLGDQKFIAGDSLTVADYSYVTILDILDVLSPSGDKFPLTKAWFDRCKTVMKDFEKVNQPGAEQLIEAAKTKLSS